MKSTIEKLENDRVALDVEVDADRVESALARAYQKVVREIDIPGFRKGRVPRSVIEQRFGVEVLYEEAIDHLLPVVYQEALAQHNLEPIDQPEIDIQEFASGKPFRFKAEVQLKPTVTLGEYKGIELTSVKRAIDEEEVDNFLERIRQQNAQLVVAERETVQDGDFALIDFEGFLNGEPFQGGAAKGYTLEVGSGSFIPGFEEQLVGAKVGETVDVNVTFPEKYPSEELAGQDAVFKVTVHEIKVRELPELNDDFAKEVSEKETLAELRELIRENLEAEVEHQATEALRNDVIQKAAESATLHVPNVLIEREAHEMVHELEHRLSHQGITLERYLEETEQTVEQIEAEFRPHAEQRVRASLVLEAIANAEGIEATDEDIEARIGELTQGYSEADAERVRAYWEQESMRESLVSSIVVRKTVDFLLEHAEITERTEEPEEAEAEADASESAEVAEAAEPAEEEIEAGQA